MKSLPNKEKSSPISHNAKEARIYATYETGRKVLRELSRVDLPNDDVPVNGLFYTKRIDRFHFIVVFLSTNDIIIIIIITLFV